MMRWINHFNWFALVSLNVCVCDDAHGHPRDAGEETTRKTTKQTTNPQHLGRGEATERRGIETEAGTEEQRSVYEQLQR